MSSPGDWRTVLDEEGREILAAYSRARDTSWWPAKPALVIIDTVESFVGPNVPVREAQKLARTACGELAWAAVPQIQLLVERFRSLGLPIVYTVVSDEQTQVGAATRGEGRGDSTLSHSRVIPEIAPAEGDFVLPKNKASAFFATSLVSYLVRNQVSRIVLAGGATSGCVRASAVDATSYGFDVKVVEDATFDRVRQLHRTALLDIDTKYGHVVTAAEVLEAVPA